jgi:hypothetical protein
MIELFLKTLEELKPTINYLKEEGLEYPEIDEFLLHYKVEEINPIIDIQNDFLLLFKRFDFKNINIGGLSFISSSSINFNSDEVEIGSVETYHFMYSKLNNSLYLFDEAEGIEIDCSTDPKNFFNGLSEIMRLNESMVDLDQNQAQNFCNALHLKFGLNKNFTEILILFD